MISSQPRPILCISGSLDGLDHAPLLKAVSEVPKLDVSVRSTGGPVEAWLSLAERLAGKLHTLFVDEACFSSCANYILPLARAVIAPKNSLIVWHGGPNAETDEALEGMGVNEVIAYDLLSRRTRTLYERSGIDVSILSFTARLPDPVKIARMFDKAGPTGPVSGYALSPSRLARCFGFKNLDGMWHAGDDNAVYTLGRKRSSALTLLESPSDDHGSEVCAEDRPSTTKAETWKLRTR